MIQFLITLLLFGVIAICFGIMDLINFHFYKAPKWMKNRRSFWGKKAMENNKWAKDRKGFPIVGQERFKFSSTYLVFLVDGWHLAKGVLLSSLSLIMTINTPIEGFYDVTSFFYILVFAVYLVIYNLLFRVFYK